MNFSVSAKDAGPEVRAARSSAPRARLTHRQPHEQCEHDPGDSQHQKGGAPAAALCHASGNRGTEPCAQTGPEGEDRQRHRPTRRRELVGKNGGGRRRAARFADADPKPRQQQLQRVRCQPARRGHGRPQAQRDGENVAAVGTVGECRHRDADGDVEHPERDAGERRDAAIGEFQFLADRLDQGRDREAVRDVKRIDRREHPQHVPAVAGSCRGRRRFAARGHRPRDGARIGARLTGSRSSPARSCGSLPRERRSRRGRARRARWRRLWPPGCAGRAPR